MDLLGVIVQSLNAVDRLQMLPSFIHWSNRLCRSSTLYLEAACYPKWWKQPPSIKKRINVTFELLFYVVQSNGRQWQTTPNNLPKKQRTRAIPVTWLGSAPCPNRPYGRILLLKNNPRSRVLPENIIGFQLFKKFPRIYWNPKVNLCSHKCLPHSPWNFNSSSGQQDSDIYLWYTVPATGLRDYLLQLITSVMKVANLMFACAAARTNHKESQHKV
jgi:hypothetical protein